MPGSKIAFSELVAHAVSAHKIKQLKESV